MSDVMRFADIRAEFDHAVGQGNAPHYMIDASLTAIQSMLDALCAQEAIRESVPVRSPEPGPTLAEQIEHMRRVSETWRLTDGGEAWHMRKAILASLERLAREGSHDKK